MEALEFSELGVMIKTVTLDNPTLKQEKDIAKAITETFAVACEESDILGYLEIYNHHEELQKKALIEEDYELEARRHEHKHWY